jgi:hypothetical protein
VDGYWPLFTSEKESDANSPINSSHIHEIFDDSGIAVYYYMPNNLVNYIHNSSCASISPPSHPSIPTLTITGPSPAIPPPPLHSTPSPVFPSSLPPPSSNLVPDAGRNSEESSLICNDGVNEYGTHVYKPGIFTDPGLNVDEVLGVVKTIDNIWIPLTNNVNYTMLIKRLNASVDWLSTNFSSEAVEFYKHQDWAKYPDFNSYQGRGNIYMTYEPDFEDRFYLIAHEYLHLQQHYLAGRIFLVDPVDIPQVWMLEGCASLVGHAFTDYAFGTGIENVRQKVLAASDDLYKCGVNQVTYDGVLASYTCSIFLVLTLWEITEVYPCSSEVWQTYCTDKHIDVPFDNITIQNVYATVKTNDYSNLDYLYKRQADMITNASAFVNFDIYHLTSPSPPLPSPPFSVPPPFNLQTSGICVNGYWPLFSSQYEANAASPANKSDIHEIEYDSGTRVIYYMPSAIDNYMHNGSCASISPHPPPPSLLPNPPNSPPSSPPRSPLPSNPFLQSPDPPSPSPTPSVPPNPPPPPDPNDYPNRLN